MPDLRDTRKKLKLYPISAVTGEGIEKLKFALAEEVERMRALTANNVEMQKA